MSSWNDKMQELRDPDKLYERTNAEREIRVNEVREKAAAKGSEPSQADLDKAYNKGAASQAERTHDKGFVGQGRNQTLKGHAAEDGITNTMREYFDTVETQVKVDANTGYSYTDVIGRGCKQDSVIMGREVKQGESLAAEIKCGQADYLSNQKGHIDNQLSGIDNQNTDHKVVVVTTDIMGLDEENTVSIDENGNVTSTVPGSNADKFISNAEAHDASVYTLPYSSYDMQMASISAVSPEQRKLDEKIYGSQKIGYTKEQNMEEVAKAREKYETEQKTEPPQQETETTQQEDEDFTQDVQSQQTIGHDEDFTQDVQSQQTIGQDEDFTQDVQSQQTVGQDEDFTQDVQSQQTVGQDEDFTQDVQSQQTVGQDEDFTEDVSGVDNTQTDQQSYTDSTYDSYDGGYSSDGGGGDYDGGSDDYSNV